MKDSKVASVLRTFSKDEFKEFEKFVASPFFRKGRDLSPLVRALKRYYPGFNQRTLTKENIYRKMNKGTYNDTVMRMLMSELLSMCEQFLMQVSLKNNAPVMHSLYGHEMEKRKLGFLSLKQIEQAREKLGGLKLGTNYFEARLFSEGAKTAYNLNNDRQAEVCDSVKDRAEYVIYYFFSFISKSLHDMDANKETFNAEYMNHILMRFLDNFNIENFLSRIDNSEFKDIMEIYLFTILSRLDEKDELYFYKLKDVLYKNIDKFDRGEQHYLITMYQSLCILKRVTINHDKYIRELFESFKYYLEHKIYKSGSSYFPILIFMGIFRIALQLKEYQWAEEFTAKYSKLISPEYSDSTKIYCNAQLSFAKGNFDKALKDIAKINMVSFPMKFDVSMLQLKIYYEINFMEQALSFIDSNTHFFRNKKVSDSFKDRRMIFLKFYKKLLLFKNGDIELDPVQLSEEISSENLPQKNWLLEKADELAGINR